MIDNTPNQTSNTLLFFVRVVVLSLFLILASRLVDLQLIKGSYYKNLAENNRIRRISIAAPRGKVFARGGEILVDNKEVRKIVVFDPEGGYKKIDAPKDYSLDDYISEWERDYKLGAKLGHVSGYVGEVNDVELGKVRGDCPDKGVRGLGALVGRSGLEEEYDCTLSGIDGEELIEVDARGNKVRVLGFKSPIPGNDIKTSIDFGLQNKVADEMEKNKGSLVVVDSNGEVLAFFSSPSYDPNIFIKKNPDQIQNLFSDKNLPLFNRAIGGIFHPGSVFKPVISAAALEEGVIDKAFIYNDEGVVVVETQYGTFKYFNWYMSQYAGTEGAVDIKKALARSVDTFFYKVGEKLGAEKISEWARKFGLDTLTNLDIPGEVYGLVPSPDWKIETKGERWFLGNTYHLSIGQGDLAVTPIEMLRATLAIASNGKLCDLHIAKRGSNCTDLDLNSETLSLIKGGMIDACSPGGTGYTFFDFSEKSDGITVACKTGTAEVNEDGKTHAWFSAFAPSSEPEIVAIVLVEGGGEGSKVAGPIAREIFNYWFKIPPKPANG